jgi:hypothetical protein
MGVSVVLHILEGWREIVSSENLFRNIKVFFLLKRVGVETKYDLPYFLKLF